MGNSFKGLGLIFDLDAETMIMARDAGIELGYFFQFGIFSYIMTAIINQTVSVDRAQSVPPLTDCFLQF